MKIETQLKLALVSLLIFCSGIVWAKFVPIQTARKVAVNHTNKNIQARALQQWRKGIPPQQAAQKLTEAQVIHTCTTVVDDIPVYYVFNLFPEGWMIISADDVARPVIGYGESGVYDPNTANQPPALTAWMDNAAAQIAEAAASGLQSHPDTAARWQHLSAAPDDFTPDLDTLALTQSVGPLIQSHWGQGGETDGWPFGYEGYSKYCPWEYTDWTHLYRDYCPTGCVATAMAQIMKYWHWPPFGYGYHEYDPEYSCSHACYGFDKRAVNFAARSYNWSDSSMPLNSPSDAIAILMSDIGVAVEMEYAPNGSQASNFDAYAAFHTYFRYQWGSMNTRVAYTDPEWISALKAEVDAGRPMLYGGCYTTCHAFICDGYDWSDNFHFNWGWDGSYDGWFSINDLTPGDHNFTTMHQAFFGIEPISEVYVDDNYYDGGYNDGHDWGIDAFNSIQNAILPVYTGGTVYVAPGTYTETVDLKGKAIHLYATGGPDITTINGNGIMRGIQCVSGEGYDRVIEGFTITGGYADGTANLDKCGGGMYNYYSSPTVINCVFYANSAILHGGGMHNEHSSPVVRNCIFSHNSAGGHGGGLMNNYDFDSDITNCVFVGNSAGAHGGGIMNNYDFVSTITNCVFFGNSAGGKGGGCCNTGTTEPYFINCTFTGNASANGSAVYNEGFDFTVANCILWGDLNDEVVNDGGFPDVSYSDIQGGYDGTGNINADPLFLDAVSGDLHLQTGSPCLDAGDNTALGGITTDLDGLPRFVDVCRLDTGYGTPPIVDMGAYELQYAWTLLPNLVANPGFETGNADGWITNWGFTLTAVTDPVHEGSYSALTGNRTAAWQGAWHSILGLLENGRTYYISGWVRMQNAESAPVALTVKYVDSTGTHYYGVDNATADDDQWTHLDGTFVSSANEPTDMFLYFEGPEAGVDFYVDDASVIEVVGDMDQSGDVDLVDFNLFGSYYGVDCSMQDCGPANLEACDSTVNLFDLVLFVADWLTGIE